MVVLANAPLYFVAAELYRRVVNSLQLLRRFQVDEFRLAKHLFYGLELGAKMLDI